MGVCQLVPVTCRIQRNWGGVGWELQLSEGVGAKAKCFPSPLLEQVPVQIHVLG